MMIRNKRNWLRTPALAGISAFWSALAAVAASGSASAQLPAAPAGASSDSAVTELAGRREFTLKDIGASQPVRLRGIEHQINFPVAIRGDEIVTGARLHLRYAHSPALVFEWSHITVLVNDEVVGNVQLKPETVDGGEQVIDIDPRTLVGYSKLGLRAVLHYTRDCEDPAHTTLWSVIANDSRLVLDVERVPLPNDLANLPAPFFDAHDSSRLVLPFVLPAEPSAEELESAAIVASWFGAMAEYRGAEFPVHLGRLPASGNAVAVATRERLGPALAVGSAHGAQLAVINNPDDESGKVLVVTGDDATSLHAAARALTLASGTLTGRSTQIANLTVPALREAYDAPRWVPTDRPVKLSERVGAEQLQVRGQYPDAIRVPWDLPPDLFYWRSKGAKFDIGYRYTPTPGTKSTLDLDVNNQFARALPLLMYDAPQKLDEKLKKKLEIPLVAKREQYRVPVYKFASDNELKWQYNFEIRKKGECEDVPEAYLRGSIDADSTIDLSGLPHYSYLPDLKLFTDGAFPFSKYADLSQTVAVLPAKPSAEEATTFLNVMGHIGDATGYPTTRIRVSDASGLNGANKDADLLVFGTPASQPLYSQWAELLPATLSEKGSRLQLVGGIERLRARFEGRDLDGAREHATKIIVEAGDKLATIMSFESPLSSKRTVVAFAALSGERLQALSTLLGDPGRRHFVGGDLTVLNVDKVSHYELAPQYSVGKLPLLLGIRWWFAQQPLMLAVMAVLLAAFSALLLYRLMRNLAISRNEGRS